MSSVTHTAIVLAGGFGTRLQSVVSNLPKPMAPVNGQPFLNYQLNYLEASGIRHVVLSTGYLSHQVEAHYRNSYRSMQISYAVEDRPLGTGGAIRLAMNSCSEETVLVLNGDSFFDIPLDSFGELHRQAGGSCSLALRRVDNAARYGRIEVDATQRVVSFLEKSATPQPGLINGGVYLLDKSVYLDQTPPEHPFSIEKDFFEKRLDDLVIRGFEFDGYFIDIGVPDDYLKAQDDFKTFKY